MNMASDRRGRWLSSLGGFVKTATRGAAARTLGRLKYTYSLATALDTEDVSSMFAWCRSRGVARARPQYLWCVLRAARTAKNLGIERVCAIEFGVAGGNGLIALESAAQAAESLLNVAIETYGFDSGGGLPEPKGVRDAPFAFQTGFFAMDEMELRARLRRTRLVLGLVEETVGEWMREEHPPVGFISFDLDYYSSTMHALSLLDAAPGKLLPRVVCYFDDIFGYVWSDFNGERAAIAEFNDSREHRKISPIHGLKYELLRWGGSAWPDQIFLAHSFDHDLYGAPDSPSSGQLPLKGRFRSS